MKEQSVILMDDGVVKMTELCHRLTFGYAGNQNVYQFRVVPTGIWKDLTIRAHWHLESGETFAATFVSEAIIKVPAAVTKNAGSGRITFEGSDGTKTVTSADVEWRVKRNSGTDDGTMPEPNTPAWQEFMDQFGSNGGDSASLEIGTVTSGETADASITDGKLNLVIPKGEPGEKGETGATGAQGPKGDKGDTGPQGEKGGQGSPGEKGEKGDRGSPGAKGEKGDTGPQGEPGEKGEKGATGAQGPKGEKGDAGAPGPQGPKGEKGDAGLQGAKGEKGDAGPQGEPGEKGDKGDAGAPGPQGPKGDKGDAGPQGPKGDKGDTGPQGPKGDKGDSADEKNYTLIEAVTLEEDTYSVIRTEEPDGTPLNLSDVIVLFKGPVCTENRQILFNIGSTTDTSVWANDRLAYFTMATAINKLGQSLILYCERYRGVWHNYLARQAVGTNPHAIVPSTVEGGAVKAIRIFAYDNKTNLIPEGTVIEIWGVRDDR